MARTAWWLADAAGAQRRVDAGGLLIGRAPQCELVVQHPRTSRSQALVHLDQDVPRLVVLGRGRTLVGGKQVTHEATIAPGDRIEVPGAVFAVLRSDEPDSDGGRGWVIELPGGGLFGISDGAFRIGGHDSDALRLTGWPEHAVTLRTTQSRLHLIAAAPVVVSGRAVEAGELAVLAAGDEVRCAGQTLRIVAGGDFGSGSTVASADGTTGALPHGVRLEFLPRGGRLHLHIADATHTVYLPGNRCDLMAALLQPPAPFRAGELLDDEALLARVWPNQSKSRVDLNTLVYRLRRDLVAAGIDATLLVQRAAGGGATRIGLGDGASIEVG
jgi:hypothetical protein